MAVTALTVTAAAAATAETAETTTTTAAEAEVRAERATVWRGSPREGGEGASLQRLARYAAFPVLMGAATWAAMAGPTVGLSPLQAANALLFGLFLSVLGLERYIPHCTGWNRRDGQALNDLGHAAVGTGLGAALGEAALQLLFGGLVTLALAGTTAPARGLWPAAWPFALQVVLVYLLADLGRYIQHRLLHGVPWLWRFHALHHSVQVLTCLKTARTHLVERATQVVFMYGPLLALGAPPEALVWYLVPNTFLGLFSHCNADLRLGPLEYLLMGPGTHRIHHSLHLDEGNSNFGSALCLWDHVFGTYLAPATRPPPVRVGIPDDPMPTSFMGQLLAPFRP